MDKIERIQQGESLPFKFHRDGADITGWVCTITAKKYPGDTASINRVVPPDSDGKSWTGFLTNTETSALAPGLWFLTGSLVKLSTNEMEQKPSRFGVAPAWTP